MPQTELDESSGRMLDRIAALLEVFSVHRSLTLTEISRHSNLPRSSTYRILQGLVQLGWVERHEARYVLGVRMFELGTVAVRQRPVPRAALPVMTDLHRRTGITVHLSTLSGGQILHVERVGTWPDTHGGWNAGSRQPAEQTAAGRALLALLPTERWPKLTFVSPSTADGMRTAEQLASEIAKIKNRAGVAVDEQGYEIGVTVVAAPIDIGEQPENFALSLSGPTRSMPIEPVIALARNAALEIRYLATGMSSGRGHRHRAAQLAMAGDAVNRMISRECTS